MGKFSVSKTQNGMTFFLTSTNGAKIASSNRSFPTKTQLLDAIKRIRDIAVSADTEDRTQLNHIAITTPKYEIHRPGGRQFYFRLLAQNGEVILMSYSYQQKISCLKGIESVRKNAPTADVMMEEDSLC